MKQLLLILTVLICQPFTAAHLAGQEQDEKKASETTQSPWKDLENTWISYRYSGYSIKRITKGKEIYEQYWMSGKLRFRHQADLAIGQQEGVNFYTKTNHRSIAPDGPLTNSNDYTGIYKISNGRFYEISRGIFADNQGKPEISEFRPMDTPIEKWLAAARRGDIKTIKAMFADGARPDAAAPGSLTALGFASNHGHIELIKLLVKHKANLSRRSGPLGAPPLVLAANTGQLESTKTLLELGADIEQPHLWFGMTPLHEAVYQGHSELMEFLLHRGANINAINNGGQTPLHVAVMRSVNQQGRSQKAQLTCLELLLKHGAKTDIKGKQGKTALDLAKERKLADAIQILSRE